MTIHTIIQWMKNANENLEFIQTLLDTFDSASARRLLQERASQVNGAVVESLIFLAKHHSEQGEIESANQLADLAIDTSEILTNAGLIADA